MRNVCSAAVLAFSILSYSLVAQSQTLTITNYNFVSQVAVRPTQWQVTFNASVINTGPALGSVTATISNAPFGITVIGGEDILNFGPVPASGQAVSTNTFTILADRSLNPAPQITQLQWTFQSTPAPPVANAGTAQTVAVGATVTLDGSGSTNPGMDGTLTYAWTLQAPFGSSAQLSFANTVHPTFKTDKVGQYVATLTVNNGTNSSAPATVTISTVNSAPVANPGTAQTVTAGTTVQLNGSGSTDVDGDSLTYSWSLQAPQNSTATLSNSAIVNPTFFADIPGIYTATLTVNDGHGNSNSNSVQITTLNSPPVANAGAAQVVSIGTTVTLNGSGSTDVDGDTLTYSWSFTNKPTNSTASLTNPTSVNPTFYVDLPGEYDIQLIVNDGHGNSNTATTKVTTSAVLAPTANPGTAQTVTAGSTVTLNGSGTDPNAPPLPLQYTWSLTCKPTGSHAVLSSTNIQSPTFVADMPTSNPGTCASNFVAQLIVSNGYVSSAPQTVNITSNATPPTANPGNAQTVNVGTPVTVSGSGSSDTNGDAISTYQWSITSAPGGSAITTASLTTPNAVTTSFTPDVAGQYVVQLIVKDSYLTSTPVPVTITANAVPTIMVSPSTLTVASNDNTQTLTVTLSTAPGGSGQTVILHNNGSAATVPSTVSFTATQTTATVNVTPNFAGSETITASAGGWVAGSATINVVTPAITLTLDSAVGLTRSKPGTITLSLPAPSPNGLTVALSAIPTGIVSFDNANVTIAAGSTTGSFNVTGQSTGTTTISAGASGWVGASQSMLVASSGTITLPTTVTLGTGQSQSYNVSLTNPAPIGGATITLTSSDPTNVYFTPSTVTINQGTTVPTSMPQVTGVNFTSATISATSPGFNSGSGTVNVSDTLQFSQSTIVLTGATTNLTLNISSPAPPGGLTINVSSSNTSFATVPATVFIPANATNVQVPVTGVAVGSSTIHANDLPNLTDVITSVSVQVVGSINLPSSVTVQAGQQTPLNISLSSAAPAGGLTVNLSSSDNTKASLSTTSVTIPAGQITPTTQPQVTGIIVGNAVATINASGNGLNSASTSVNVTPGTASAITATGSGQSATVGQAFSTPIVVTLQDSHGNAVPNVTVVFTAPTTGPSATFTSSSFITNASGQVTVNATANSVANTSSTPNYTVSISAPSVSPSITPYSITLSNNAGPAASISVSNGGQTATVGTGFTSNILATVLDSFSNPVSGVSVTFASPSTGAGATFAPANAQNTNGQGQVSVSATANNTAGTYNSTATAAGVGTAATFSLTNKAASPGQITAGTGGGQSQVIGVQFAQPLVVTVKDSFGNPVTGATVNFAGPSTGASIVAATATTNTSGVANGLVTANSTASTTAYTVNATVQGFANAGTATFSLTNTVASAAFIIVTPSSNGTPQSATVNTQFANQLSVTVQDSGHNPIQNQTVTFTVPSTGPSAALTGTLTTNSSGIVALTATANKISGASYNVTASVGGVNTPATFVLTNNPGAAATLAAGTGAGQSANLGTQFTNPLVVTVTDQYGNAVADNTVVSFVGPSTGASISSTTANTSNGVASAHVTANNTLGSYNVTASVSGTSSTATFALSNTTQPASVTPVSGSGQSATVGTNFSQPLKALVQDVNHNGIPGVTVTFGSPASGAGFSGNNTAVSDGTGTATFTPKANTVAGSYPVNISVPGINTPSAFNMTNVAGTAATVTPVSGGSGQSATVGTVFGTALSVTVVDQYGNAVANNTSVQFAGPGSGPSIVLTTATTTNGTASKVVTANNIAGGPYTVTASAGSGSGTFSLTNTPGAAAVVTYGSGTGQSTTINSAFAQPLVVTVTDGFGNLVSGATVTYTGPTTGPGISQTVTATSVAGVASANVSANASIGGPYTVQASVGTSSKAQFSLTNQAPAPAAIAVSAGSGQSTTIYNAFPTNLAALVTDAGGNPLPGITVTFQVGFNQTTGAGGNFVTGSSATAVTNSSGIATASTLVANGNGTTTIAGNTFNSAAFTVSASITTSPGITPASFGLTNNNTASTQIVVTSASVGKGLQTSITVTLPGGCQSSVACLVSLSSSDSTKALISGSPTAVGSASGQATLNPGDSSTIVFVQGVSTSGSATITATLSGYTNGTSTVLVTPSGFVIVPPSPLPIGTPSYTTAVGASNSTFSVQAVQLNPTTLAYMQGTSSQSVSGGSSVSVPVGSSPAGVVFLSPPGGGSSVNFVGNDSSYPVILVPENSGTTTVTAGTPTGFTTPGQSQNSLSVTVSAAGFNTPTSTTVGQWLETSQTVTFTSQLGINTGGSEIFITSNDPTKLLLSNDPTLQGSQEININIGANVSASSVSFYVQALVSSGSVTYTVSDPGDGFTPVTGTINFTPSGFVIGPPNGPGTSTFVDSSTLIGPSAVNIYPAQLTAGGAYVGVGMLAGGLSVTVNVNNNNSSAGTIPAATIIGGETVGGILNADDYFTPNVVGTTQTALLTVQTPSSPAGFMTPTSDTTLTVYVFPPGMILSDTGSLGQNLQMQATITLETGVVAPSGGLPISVSTSSPNLLISTSATTAGTQTATLTIPANGNSVTYWLQAVCTTGSCASQFQPGTNTSATYTATANGFSSATHTINFMPSGVAISNGQANPGTTNGNTVTVTLASGNPVTFDVLTVQLCATITTTCSTLNGVDANSSLNPNEYLVPQVGNLTVGLNVGSVGGTVSTPVTITPGTGGVQISYTPTSKETGGTIKVGSVSPTGEGLIVAAGGGKTLTVNVQ